MKTKPSLYVLAAAAGALVLQFFFLSTDDSAPSPSPPQTTPVAGTVNASAPEAIPSGLSLVIRGPTNVIKQGDEIPIEFIISNHGTVDHKCSDRNYDRSGRMGEYKLTAKTATGETIPDARQHFQPGMAGGLSQPRVLHPGESFSKIIPLNLWALIKEPGRYEVAGTYEDALGSVRSDPISLTVLPRTKEEMADYIRDLTDQVAAQLAAQNGGPPSVSQDLVMKLMYSCSPQSIPTLLGIMCQTNLGGGNARFWATAALADYVPHSEETRQAILEAAIRHGLNGTGLDQLLLAHEFNNREMNPIIARALAVNNPGEWQAGVWLALHYYDDAFTPWLIAIARDSNARGDTRSVAMRVLAFHRTDAGVKAIKTLLRDPGPEMLRPLFETIANGYSSRDTAPAGRPLQPEDFTAEDLRPLIERLLASTKQALQLQLSGVILAKSFGSDALTAPLMALATNPSPYIRYQAICALALNRTDEGVKLLKTLLQDPDPKTSQTAEAAIRNAYTSRGDARGRPLRPDDFDAKFQRPAPALPK
jgi:hypothetical protein